MPTKLFLTIATCSIGAAVQGWDQTGTNGANIFFPTEYGIGSDSTRDTLILGLVNAGPYLGSAYVFARPPILPSYTTNHSTVCLAAGFLILSTTTSVVAVSSSSLLTSASGLSSARPLVTIGSSSSSTVFSWVSEWEPRRPPSPFTLLKTRLQAFEVNTTHHYRSETLCSHGIRCPGHELANVDCFWFVIRSKYMRSELTR